MKSNPTFYYALYFVFFFVAISFSILINWLLLRFSRNLGIRGDVKIDEERWASFKPAIGGISFFIVFLVSISLLGFLPFEYEQMFNKQIIGIMAACTLGFLLGLADDAYNTNPLLKFIGQMSCAFILIVMDVYIQLTGIPSVDFVFTTIWVIGMMNSINMLDNMDGITTSISATIIFGAIVFLFITGESMNIFNILLFGVLGALVGFLLFNWTPAKIYMGDTGSLFLGVFLAAISMVFFWNYRSDSPEIFQLKQFVVPMLMFIVPIIDTTTVTIRRLLRKQSPFVGGKDHITHHLAYVGLRDNQVAIILIALSMLSIPFISLVITDTIEWNFEYTLAAFIYFFVIFGVIQVLYNKGKMKKKLASK